MKITRLPLLFAAFAVATLAFAPLAAAAPADWESMDVTVHDEGTAAVIMVSGTLPETAKLPAEVELAVPTGGEIQWSGEILGGDPSADPSVETSKTTAGGFDVYRFTLTKARVGQIEVAAPAFFQVDGTGRSGTMAWTATSDVAELRLSVRVPSGAQITTFTPGAEVLSDPQGTTYVDRTFKDVKAGQQSALNVAYNPPAAAAAAPTAATDSTLPIIITLLITAIGAAGAAIAINRKMKRRTAYLNAADEADDDAPVEQSHAFEDTEVEVTVAAAPAKPRPAAQSKVAPKRSNAVLIVTGLVITAAVAAGIMASQSSSDVTVLPNGFSRSFTQGDPCSGVTFELTKAPTKKEAEQIFDALAPVTPLSAIAYTDTPRLEVSFCDSVSSAEKVQAAVAPTGLVGKVIATGPPASLK